MNYDILRVHIDETLTTIKQTFDDRSVSRAQAAYCYIIAGNQLLAPHNIKRDSGAFVTAFDGIPLKTAKSSDSTVIKDRKYIELPGLIFDFDKDNGIDYLAYISDGGPGCPPRFTKTKFTRTTPSESEWLFTHPNLKPSPSNPYYYRIGNIIYTLGVESVPVPALEGGFYMTIPPLQEIDIDAPFAFPMELMPVLKRQVIDLIRMNWFFPSERKNEGSDDPTQKAVPQKVISVNDQQQQ